jgi:hypothetical protein
MGRVKSYMWDEAERIISETYKRVSEGDITFDDTEKIYVDELTNEDKACLQMLGIQDEIDFREEVEND